MLRADQQAGARPVETSVQLTGFVCRGDVELEGGLGGSLVVVVGRWCLVKCGGCGGGEESCCCSKCKKLGRGVHGGRCVVVMVCLESA